MIINLISVIEQISLLLSPIQCNIKKYIISQIRNVKSEVSSRIISKYIIRK